MTKMLRYSPREKQKDIEEWHKWMFLSQHVTRRGLNEHSCDLRELFFKHVQRVRAVAFDWKSDSEVYIVTNQLWYRSTYVCKCVRVTDVACEGARAVRKHVRLVQSTETNWNYRRPRSEVYRHDENCLGIYVCYVLGVQKEFKPAVKIKDSKQSKWIYR